MFQEWNQGCTDGNDLLRRYVHEYYFFRRSFQNVRAAAAGYVLMLEESMFIQRFRCLCNNLAFFNVGCYIVAFVGYMVILWIYETVRSFNQTVLVDDTVVGQRGNQPDVRTFRGFYRAHAAVVRVMYVSNFEPCTFTGQTARSQCRQTTLVCQFCQRIGLVHKLGQLGGTEEFLDSCHYRTDVYQCLRCHLVLILCRHTFTDYTFNTGQTDAELILQQFANSTNAAVSQMVDIIRFTKALHHVQAVVDERDDVFSGQCTEIVVQIAVVADNLNRCTFILEKGNYYRAFSCKYSAFFDALDGIAVNAGVSFNDDFSCFRINDRILNDMSFQTMLPAQLLAQLITAYLGQVIAVRIIEEIVKQGCTAVYSSRFTRTELLVYFNKRFFCGTGWILFQCLFNVYIMGKQFQNIFIAGEAQCTYKYSGRHLAVTVNTNRQCAVGIGFQFNPCAAVWNNLSGINHLAVSILFAFEINARGTDELRYDDTFCTIDDKCTGIRHNREIAHEQFMFLDFSGVFVYQSYIYLERGRVCCIPCLTFLNAVFLFSEIVIPKIQGPFLCFIFNRGNIIEDLFQPFLLKPCI